MLSVPKLSGEWEQIPALTSKGEAHRRDVMGAEAPRLRVGGAPERHLQPEKLPMETCKAEGFAYGIRRFVNESHHGSRD